MQKNILKKFLPYTLLLLVVFSFVAVYTTYGESTPEQDSAEARKRYESGLAKQRYEKGLADQARAKAFAEQNNGEGDIPLQDFSKELDEAIAATEVSDTSQAKLYNVGAGTEAEPDKKGALAKGAAGIIGCTGANILAQMLASAITSFIAQNISNVTDLLTNVPVAEKGNVGANIRTDTQARTGTVISASIFGFGGAAIVFPSWDAIAYCITNEIITYIADSTIAWVRGGFEGNPAFIDNPEQFFKNMADLEASSFLQGLAYGSAGLNICEPFRAQLVLSIARSHLASQYGSGGANGYSRGGFESGNIRGGGGGYGGCTLDDIEGNFKGFLKGDFSKGGWNSWFNVTQVDANNPYSTYFKLQAQLNGSINKKAAVVSKELDWGNGFLSFKKCEEGNCKITTPGTVIESQLEKTLGIAKDRLVLAEKFDQVIAVVVDQLINTALDKVFEELSE